MPAGPGRGPRASSPGPAPQAGCVRRAHKLRRQALGATGVTKGGPLGAGTAGWPPGPIRGSCPACQGEDAEQKDPLPQGASFGQRPFLSRQEVDSTGLTAGAPSAAEESRGKARKLPLPHRYCLSPWIQLCLKSRVTAGPSSWSVLPQLSGACCLLRFHHLHLNGPGQPRPTPNKPLEVPMERSPPLAWRCRRPQPRSISGKGPLRSSDCRHLPRPHGAPGERVASSLARGPSSTLRW